MFSDFNIIYPHFEKDLKTACLVVESYIPNLKREVINDKGFYCYMVITVSAFTKIKISASPLSEDNYILFEKQEMSGKEHILSLSKSDLIDYVKCIPTILDVYFVSKDGKD